MSIFYRINLFLWALLSLLPLSISAQQYKDSTLTPNTRALDLLQHMSKKEKFRQLFMVPFDASISKQDLTDGIFGFQHGAVGQNNQVAGQLLNYADASEIKQSTEEINLIQKYLIDSTRLGIPQLAFDEALHGLVRKGATLFPQAIALAATWDTLLVYQCAEAIAQECKSRGIRQILSPVLNLATDPRWGRTEETYGEDPYLSSEIGVAFTSAFENNNVITTPKHFIVNHGDGGRDSYPVQISEQYLQEVYLVPFKACIQRAKSRSIMTAYNSFNGTPCSSNNHLLKDILRDQLGFTGFVISDAGATGGANVLHMTSRDYPESSAEALNNGLDVIFQTSLNHESLFFPPVNDGSVIEANLDSAVYHVLKAKFQLGLFENPYSDPEKARLINGSAEHRILSLKAATKSIVLLKNDNTLPLTTKTKKILITGPDAEEARPGGYSGPGITPISILEGLKNRVADSVEIIYTKGCSRSYNPWTTIDSTWFLSEKPNHDNGKRKRPRHGLNGFYYSTLERSQKPVATRVDPTIDFHWTLFSPFPEKLPSDFYSVEWIGWITPPADGEYTLAIEGNDGFQIWIDDTLRINRPEKVTENHYPFSWRAKKGTLYPIRIIFNESVGNARIRLLFKNNNELNEQEEINKAVKLAKEADIIVVAAGIEEGEFQDRALLNLPGKQEQLIQQLSQSGKPVVVLLTGGSAITMSHWIDKTEAVLMNWYGGDEAGTAVASILYGDVNPSGRLPITFPQHEGQLPLPYLHKPTGRGDEYINLSGQPLFPFGYGLSYTTFSYDSIDIPEKEINTNKTAIVRVKITNRGKRTGEETVQLYLHDEIATLARPLRELKGFAKVTLKPSESKWLTFIITPEMRSFKNKNLESVQEPGIFRITIGRSSLDQRLRATLSVKP